MRRTAERVFPLEQTGALLEATAITHSFARPALREVDLRVWPGEVHALLGPNGAGKTTLLRVVSGLLQPQEGSLRLAGVDGIRDPLGIRKHIGLMPSGDGTLYRRLSAFENLVFFARLHGFRKREAVSRAGELLALVGLEEHAEKRVHAYSHGMQKRLAFARALLSEPSILLIDEATHDLDPEAARLVRDLTLAAANAGTAVVWATQRLDEIRGFAETVTMLNAGRACFTGSVAELIGRSVPTRYLLRLHNGRAPVSALTSSLNRALGPTGTIAPAPRSTDEDFVLVLGQGHVIGDALPVFDRAGVRIVACREERSGLEEAFLALASGDAA